MMKSILALFTLLTTGQWAMAQPRTDSLLQQQLLQGSTGLVRQVAADPTQYRLQVIYTQIDRTETNAPVFRHFFYHYDPGQYFNPASMVKMPLAFLSLEKLNDLGKKGIGRETPMAFDSSMPWHRPLYTDTTAASGLPSLSHFIKKAFLLSDNDAYNRMYQWVGQPEINHRLWAKGYPNARILRQFMGLSPAQNRITNPIRFTNPQGNLLYKPPTQEAADTVPFGPGLRLGRAHFNRADSLVQGPFDFTGHNDLSLFDMQQMLQSVMFPESSPASQRFNLRSDDYAFLRKWMSAYCSETDDPKYDTTKYYNSYVKFFFRDSTHRMPPQVRVFNKVGWAYGFLTDVSYVADFENGIEYMLSATLYTNSDEVLNDGKYDYDTVGFPFLYQLGQHIYQYEIHRPRACKPDLSAFRIEYDRRDPDNPRPQIATVDN